MKNILNFIKNPKLKMILILTFLLILYTGLCAISYATTASSDIANSVFRLHVIANSDSDTDQNLKYKVRDALLEYMNNICKDCSSKNEAIELVELHQNEFKEVALDTIKKEGFNYFISINSYINKFNSFLYFKD